MTQYNTLTVKLSNSQLNKLKSWIKLGTEVTLNLSSNLMGNSNNATNFPHKFQGFLKCLQMVLQLIKNAKKYDTVRRIYLGHTYFWKYFTTCSQKRNRYS